ncbi:hypothetical protein D3C73_1342990 [compost metagenome]
MRIVDVICVEAQRLPLLINRQHRTGRKVDSNPNNIGRINACFSDDCRNRLSEHFQIIVRMLQSPVMLKLDAGARQMLINYMVRVRSDMICNLASVRQIYEHSASGLCSIVYTNGIFSTQMSPLLDRVCIMKYEQ